MPLGRSSVARRVMETRPWRPNGTNTSGEVFGPGPVFPLLPRRLLTFTGPTTWRFALWVAGDLAKAAEGVGSRLVICFVSFFFILFTLSCAGALRDRVALVHAMPVV